MIISFSNFIWNFSFPDLILGVEFLLFYFYARCSSSSVTKEVPTFPTTIPAALFAMFKESFHEFCVVWQSPTIASTVSPAPTTS